VPLGIPDGFVWTSGDRRPGTIPYGNFGRWAVHTDTDGHDVAGKTATVTRTVQIDTTAPTLVVSAPVNNESTSSTPFYHQRTSAGHGRRRILGQHDLQRCRVQQRRRVQLDCLDLDRDELEQELNLGSTEARGP